MIIKNWKITGDTHGNFARFKSYPEEFKKDPCGAVIVLGDLGLNFFFDERDDEMKNYLSSNYKFRIYGVRGNHEARPQDVADMKLIYDPDVMGEVYMQEKYPTIRYFKDWGIYIIDGFTVAVIGGAYSVDKWYRLDMAKAKGSKWSGWFENEMLDTKEMIECTKDLTNQKVDMVFTHTCPLCWEPTDLFLDFVDQSTVDKTMECFLEEIGQCFSWRGWCFGHYHADRMERPGVQQFYKNTEDLFDVWNRFVDSNYKADEISKALKYEKTDAVLAARGL